MKFSADSWPSDSLTFQGNKYCTGQKVSSGFSVPSYAVIYLQSLISRIIIYLFFPPSHSQMRILSHLSFIYSTIIYYVFYRWLNKCTISHRLLYHEKLDLRLTERQAHSKDPDLEVIWKLHNIYLYFLDRSWMWYLLSMKYLPYVT